MKLLGIWLGLAVVCCGIIGCGGGGPEVGSPSTPASAPPQPPGAVPAEANKTKNLNSGPPKPP